jgi:2,3-bisphosphoglycerate-independent phosphoglycerate mutase
VDGRVLKRIVDAMEASSEEYRILVLPDHPTPICVRTHTGEPVPYLLYDSRTKQDGIHIYNEKEAVKSRHVWKEGYRLIDHLFEA